MSELSLDVLERCQAEAQRTAALFRLPFRRRTWHGLQGNWQGAGSGSSLDFQDHRPYVAGDDPRYINWLAYARSGHYTMKLYRQEVSPALDMLVDCSGSMFVDEAKARRVAELIYWAWECAAQSGASTRVYAWRGAEAEPLSPEIIGSHRWFSTEAAAAHAETLPDLPWRHGSMRVVISDLLWPGDVAPMLQRLGEGSGFGIIFAPFSRDEAQPGWSGNMEMVDSETAQVRPQRVDPDILARYSSAYRQHFDIWANQAIRFHTPLARVPAEGELADALRLNAGESGAVEWAA
jgi:hypothetical protein